MDTKQDNGSPQENHKNPSQDPDTKKSMKFAAIFFLIVILIFFGTLGIKKLPIFTNGNSTLTLEQKFNKVETGQEIKDGFLYNNFPFVKHDGLWFTRFLYNGNLIVLTLHHTPEEVINISSSGKIAEEFFKTKEIYITFDPEGSDLEYTALSAAEISLSIVKSFNGVPIAACTENKTSSCADRPIVNCETENSSVVYINNSDGDTGIRFRDRCMIVNGDGPELLRATEKLIYQWYGFI